MKVNIISYTLNKIKLKRQNETMVINSGVVRLSARVVRNKRFEKKTLKIEE